MKAVQAFFFIPLLAAQAAIAAQVEPSLTGLSEQEPQVLAFYDRQCNQYADAAGLSGEQRDAYLAECKADAPSIWPVGKAEDEE